MEHACKASFARYRPYWRCRATSYPPRRPCAERAWTLRHAARGAFPLVEPCPPTRACLRAQRLARAARGRKTSTYTEYSQQVRKPILSPRAHLRLHLNSGHREELSTQTVFTLSLETSDELLGPPAIYKNIGRHKPVFGLGEKLLGSEWHDAHRCSICTRWWWRCIGTTFCRQDGILDGTHHYC